MTGPLIFQKQGRTYENWPLSAGLVHVRVTDAEGRTGMGSADNGLDAKRHADDDLRRSASNQDTSPTGAPRDRAAGSGS